jgi:hypothetical protein
LATRSSKRIVEACASASDFSGSSFPSAWTRPQLLSFGLDQACSHDVLDVFEAPESFFRDFAELFVFHRGTLPRSTASAKVSKRPGSDP